MKEEKFVFKQFAVNNNSFAGMTTKAAGNFALNGCPTKAFDMADKALTLTGFNGFGNIVMRAETHSDKVFVFSELENNISTQVVCDGVIYRGQGAAVFFPGGCPAIAFRDKKANISGILHGGWKSVTQGIVDNFLREWEFVGGKKENTQIIFLPATCKDGAVYKGKGYNYFKKIIFPAIEKMRPRDSFRFINVVRGYLDEYQYIKFDLMRLIVFLLMKKKYEDMTDVGGCVCCGDKFWFYDRDDKDGKYRNAAFIISG